MSLAGQFPQNQGLFMMREIIYIYTSVGSSFRIISCIASDSIRVESIVSTCSRLPFTVVGVFIWGSGELFCCNNPRNFDFPF